MILRILPLLLLFSALISTEANSQIISTFDPLGSLPVGVGFGNDEVFVHENFDSVIQVFDRNGSPLRTIPSPGVSSDDYDIDFADSALNVGGVPVPAGSLLVVNGDSSPDMLFALDPSDGNVLASVGLGDQSTVGIGFDSSSGLVYSIDWVSDLVREFDPSNGLQTNSFSTAPLGSSAFDVFYGDIDVDADGNLQVVTDVLEQTRVLTTSGDFVQDYDLALISPNDNLDLSGIAFDVARGEAWVSSRNGLVYQLAGFPQVPEPHSLLLIIPALLGIGVRRRR